MSEFLAEASVLISPDLTAFRAKLLAELTAATTNLPPITVPVATAATSQVAKASQEVATSAKVATTALDAQSVAAQTAGKTNQQLAASHASISASNRALATAARQFAVAQEVVVGASSDAAAAQTTYARAQAASLEAEKAALAAGKSRSVLQQNLARQLVESTAAFEAEALAALKSARAQGVYSAALSRTAGLQRAGVSAISETARARAQYQAAISANIAADRAWRAALASGDKALLQSAASLFSRTAGIEAETNAVLKAAIAEDARVAAIRKSEAEEAAATKTTAARTAGLSRGIGTQALAFGGLRGAVLGAQPAFIAGAAAAIAFAAAVKSAADLESELNVFRITAQATGVEMLRVADAAARLGADVTLPSVGASDAAEAMTELAKAGLSVQDSIDGARGVLQLATAAQLDNAAATTIAASALNAFGLAGDQAVHVADVLANAANEAQGGIDEIGIALQQSAAVARQAGLSLEQTATVLTILAQNGLRGSDAGTSFRTSLIRLINPSAKAAAIIKDLGLQLRDASGNIRLDVFDQFVKATEDMTRAQRDQALAVIFGQDAIRAAAILAREGTSGFAETAAALDRQGSAAELAAARLSGLTGAAENLKNQLASLGLTLGGLATGPLTALASGIAGTVGTLNTMAQGLLKVGETAKSALGDLNDLATVDIGGLEISPSRILDVTRALTNPVTQAAKVIEFAQDQLGDSGFAIAVARRQVIGLVEDLNKVGGVTKLNKTVTDLQKLSAELKAGDQQSQLLGADIDKFIRKLQDVSTSEIDPFELSIEIPPELLSGEPGRVAGEASKAAFLKAIRLTGDEDFGFQNFVTGLKTQAEHNASGTWEPLRNAIKREQEKTRASIAGGNQKINILEGSALAIKIRGGSRENQALLANLADQEREQRKVLEARQALLKPNQVTSPKLREAQQALNQTLEAEQAIRDQMSADVKSAAEESKQKAEQAATDAQRARDEADQAFLDSLQPRRTKIDRGISRASGTEALQDDINANRALKTRLKREIDLIKDNVRDAKDAATQIASRVTELIGVGQTLTRLRQEKAAAQRKIAEDRAAERTALLEGRVQLAEARGDKGAEVAAIDLLIADVNKRIAKTKKATSAFVQLQIERQELLNKRKEVLEQDEEAKGQQQGTTAFSLLQQAAATFNANAGNLIGGSQPFAGPSGFTADLAQFLRRQQTTGSAQTFTLPGKAADDTLVSSNTQLVKAIVDLTQVIRDGPQKGNRTALATVVDRNDRAHFANATQARRQVEGRSGI